MMKRATVGASGPLAPISFQGQAGRSPPREEALDFSAWLDWHVPALRLRHAEARRLPAYSSVLAAVSQGGEDNGEVCAPPFRRIPWPGRRGRRHRSRRAVRGRWLAAGPAGRDRGIARLVQTGGSR